MASLSRRGLIVLPVVGALSGCSLASSAVVLAIDPNSVTSSLVAFDAYAEDHGYRKLASRYEGWFEYEGRDTTLRIMQYRILAESPVFTFEVVFRLREPGPVWEWFGGGPDVDEMAKDFERFALQLNGVRLRESAH